MEESKQQQELLLQMQHQQQMQQRQQQLFMMQQLQNQHQQQAAMSRFPSNTDAHLRPTGLFQNRPVNPFLQNANPNPSFHQNVTSQQMMMMMHQQQQQQKSMMMMQQQQQQQQQKSMNPLNQSEFQFAYQDAWRVSHPDFKRPFASLEDACERLLPYHVVADYEAEEDDRIVDSKTTGETLSRGQQWDNNIAAKVAEFTATFEKQAQAFNMITQKKKDGELRSEERLMIEQWVLHDERKTCIDLKTELDREMKAQEAMRLRMAAFAQSGQVRGVESQQQQLQQQSSRTEMMARNPLRANAIGNHGEQGRNVMNPDEMTMMMMMNGWGNNNGNSQREEKEPLEEDFLNDEENENGETGVHENWRGNAEFDLNTTR